MWRRPVEHCQSTAMSSRRVCRNNAVPSRSAGVYTVGNLYFLKDAKVHVGLGHPPQHGPWHLSRNKGYRGYIHLRIGLVQHCCYRRAKMTSQWIGSVPPAGATFCGEGRPEIWTQRCWLPDVNKGTEVVHSGMLPCPPRHLEDRYCCCRALGAPNGRQTAGGGKN